MLKTTWNDGVARAVFITVLNKGMEETYILGKVTTCEQAVKIIEKAIEAHKGEGRSFVRFFELPAPIG